MSRFVKHRYWNSLSESDRAKYGRIINWYFTITLFACMSGTFYVVTNVWHWPFLLAWTLGSALGAILGLVAIIAPIWGFLTLVQIFGRKTPPVADPDKE